MGYTPASKALEGLTVIDMTHARAGPVCVRQLADWGANVVRIERPGNPEDFAARHEAAGDLVRGPVRAAVAHDRPVRVGAPRPE